MNEKEFFKELLKKTHTTFLKSETYKKFPDENWNSAICDTPIQQGEGIFFGLNWGGKNIDQQTAYPPKDKKRNWQFISHSRRYFKSFVGKEIENLNYSNFCFFRTPKASQLVYEDWKLAYPLFKEYVDYINPPWTLMLGKSDYVLAQHVTNKETFSVWDEKNNKTVNGYCGTLFEQYSFGAVPHPQARISSEARNKIWQNVSTKLLKDQL